MDDMHKVLQAVCFGMVVANFLLNTSRGLKAIEFLMECLILLNRKALEKVKKHTVPIYIELCSQLFLLLRSHR